MDSATFNAAVGSTGIVEKETVMLPVCGGKIAGPSHARSFTSHIMCVTVLLKSSDVHFSESLLKFPA